MLAPGRQSGQTVAMFRRQPSGWIVLAIVMAALAVVTVIGGLWAIANGNWFALIATPVNLLIYYWIGVGAWRRTEERPSQRARA